jgi:hypothetical protein
MRLGDRIKRSGHAPTVLDSNQPGHDLPPGGRRRPGPAPLTARLAARPYPWYRLL